ncbi:MAG: methyltransferase domain-containing protein [Zavarzinella sp.]
MGYQLAIQLQGLIPERVETNFQQAGLVCQPCRQIDLDSPWTWYWLNQLKIPIIYHRKLWELAYVMQAIMENLTWNQGVRGLGFGCGEEPLPSLMVQMGAKVTVTDLAPEASAGKGWSETNQHTSTLAKVHNAGLVDQKLFFDNAELKYVDMNAIPAELDGQYDYCWSVCALEHLGSIQHGLDFILNSAKTLKPGGVAVHTTEINYTKADETIDNYPTVIFLRKHFEQLAARAKELGLEMKPLSFDVGDQPLDRFIDMPPYIFDNEAVMGQWPSQFGNSPPQKGNNNLQQAHLKMLLDGFPSTCYGVIIKKPV